MAGYKERKELQRDLDYIRETFYPKWDKKREWKIQRVWHLPFEGKYEVKSKRILIRNVLEDKDEFYKLLIHEVCHSVAFHHGKKFTNRLLKAKEKAEQTGQKELALKLGKDIESYDPDKRQIIGATDIYNRIGEIVVDAPQVSWANLLKFLSRENAMYPEEFLKKFKKAKNVFLSCKKEQRERQKISKKREALLHLTK